MLGVLADHILGSNNDTMHSQRRQRSIVSTIYIDDLLKRFIIHRLCMGILSYRREFRTLEMNR